MEIITPVGSKLLVLPVEIENYITKGNIEVVTLDLRASQIVSVGTEAHDIYKVGDVVIHPKGAGVGQHYRGKAHWWLDGRPTNNGGDIWGIITKEVTKKDKGDNL